MQKDLLDQIKSGLLRELSDADEPQHRYHDPDTGREFGVRRFMGSDTLEAPMRQHYFLVEYTPNGRMAEMDARGHVTRAWDEPRIKALEARVGPNELMAALADAGINLDQMVLASGGYCVGAIYYDALDDCAAAIATALTDDVRYRHVRPLTAEEAATHAERKTAASRAFWQEQAQVMADSDAGDSELFRGCHSILGPLSAEARQRIAAYLDAPGRDAWNDVRGLHITGVDTLWQAWIAHDPLAPKQDDGRFPSAAVLRDAIRAAVANRRADIEAHPGQEAPARHSPRPG